MFSPVCTGSGFIGRSQPCCLGASCGRCSGTDLRRMELSGAATERFGASCRTPPLRHEAVRRSSIADCADVTRIRAPRRLHPGYVSSSTACSPDGAKRTPAFMRGGPANSGRGPVSVPIRLVEVSIEVKPRFTVDSSFPPCGAGFSSAEPACTGCDPGNLAPPVHPASDNLFGPPRGAVFPALAI